MRRWFWHNGPVFFCALILMGLTLASFPQPLSAKEEMEGIAFSNHERECATCQYIHEQQERVKAGLKVKIDTRIVPDDFWERKAEVRPADAWNWPEFYYPVRSNRVDSDDDGLRECRYRLFFDGYTTSGLFTAVETEALRNEFRRCIAIYNEVLRYVGLEYIEVTDSSYHVPVRAQSDVDIDGAAGRAYLFGSFYGNNSTQIEFNFELEHYYAFLSLTDNGAPRAKYRNPPGNPFVIVFPDGTFRRRKTNGRTVDAINISDTMLHEIGHSVGLLHPFEALDNSTGNESDSYLIDWLAHPVVGVSPPRTRSTTINGEDVEQLNWPRSMWNTFMTYDRDSDKSIYPGLPPSVKAYIAHYYGSTLTNRTSAQQLLDLAVGEYQQYSAIGRDEMDQEAEPNNSLAQANPVQVGKPLLGALASTNPSNNYREAFTDLGDWYEFEVAAADVDREMEIAVSFAEIEYGFTTSYYYYTNGPKWNGNCQIHLHRPSGGTLKSSRAEFPSLEFTPSQAGTYRVGIVKPDNSGDIQPIKDYVLEVSFSDGGLPNAPTFTPTPSFTPTPQPSFTPTPLVLTTDFLMGPIELVQINGNRTVKISEPVTNSEVFFRYLFKNDGLEPVSQYTYECYVDGALHDRRDITREFLDGFYYQDIVQNGWVPTTPGRHSVEIRLLVDGDEAPDNNRNTLDIFVAEEAVPIETPTATRTFTPSNTPSPTTVLPTPVPEPADLEALEVFLILDDGNDDSSDDVRVENPAPGQDVRFVARVRNNGDVDLSTYDVEVYVNGTRFNSGSSSAGISAGEIRRWRSSVWNETQEGVYTVEWRFIYAEDPTPGNNNLSYTFLVGSGVPPTATPTRTFTPTDIPTQPPTATPTPLPADLEIVEIFLILDDGNSDSSDDVRVENPAPGQDIRFVARVQNVGEVDLSTYGVRVYVNGELFNTGTPSSSIPAGSTWRWRTTVWNETQEGTYIVEWRFEHDQDPTPDNNRMSLTFDVGSGGPVTTPTHTSTPSPTPTVQTGLEYDLQVQRVYMVLDDGGGSFDDDVEIENPAPGQAVRFMAQMRNPGPDNNPYYSFEVHLDEDYFTASVDDDGLRAGFRTRWRTRSHTFDADGVHTVAWYFYANEDTDLSNNNGELTFIVGDPDVTPTPTPTAETPGAVPTLTPTITPTPIATPTFHIRFVDEIVLSQGFGGGTFVNVRNFDDLNGTLTAVQRSFQGLPDAFVQRIGGGFGRAVYLSTGDVNGDGSADIVTSFGPVTQDGAEFPNIVIPRDGRTRQVIGSSFVAFPNGTGTSVNYNGGEVRTAVGNFTGGEYSQIAAAQGYGGSGVIRLIEYTGQSAPNSWTVRSQVDGLVSGAKTGNANGGLTLASGDLDGDGLDELVVGQTNSASSQTIFHVLDFNVDGTIASRLAFAGFISRFRGDGGIELAIADLDGDGFSEILAASQGNSRNHGDDRDDAPLNVVSVVQPVVSNGSITGFQRPSRSVFTVFTEAQNPSGAISIAAGELNGDPSDGQEILVGTGSLYSIDGFTHTPVNPAPASRYRVLKVPFDGTEVGNLVNVAGGNQGFTAYSGNFNPTSGAVFVGAVDTD